VRGATAQGKEVWESGRGNEIQEGGGFLCGQVIVQESAKKPMATKKEKTKIARGKGRVKGERALPNKIKREDASLPQRKAR